MPDQIDYIRRTAAMQDRSDSDLLREALRKFVDYSDRENSKGRGVEFPHTERTGDYKNQPVLVPNNLIADIKFVYIAAKRKYNISEAARIGINKMMHKPIKL
jgi:hypothetical protein